MQLPESTAAFDVFYKLDEVWPSQSLERIQALGATDKDFLASVGLRPCAELERPQFAAAGEHARPRPLRLSELRHDIRAQIIMLSRSEGGIGAGRGGSGRGLEPATSGVTGRRSNQLDGRPQGLALSHLACLGGQVSEEASSLPT